MQKIMTWALNYIEPILYVTTALLLLGLGYYEGSSSKQAEWDKEKLEATQGVLKTERNGSNSLNGVAHDYQNAVADVDAYYNGLPTTNPGNMPAITPSTSGVNGCACNNEFSQGLRHASERQAQMVLALRKVVITDREICNGK